MLGEEDGVAKTPAWAAELCDVPARTITALAREWASKRTSLAGGTKGGEGGACRQAYATESARLMVLLQAMQGLGKPGVSIWGTANGPPYNATLEFPGYAAGGFNLIADKPAVNPVKQRLYRLTVARGHPRPAHQLDGRGVLRQLHRAAVHQFTYPLPGASEVKMFYRYGGAFLATMTDTNRWVRMYQSPKLEFVVNQDCWWSTETKLGRRHPAGLHQPRAQRHREWASSGGYSAHASGSANHRVIVYQQKCVEPEGESKADYDIFVELAERLGVKEEFTEGNTFEEWIRKMFDYSDLPDYISFEDFKEKGYFVVPQVEDYKATPSLRWFAEGRPCDTPDEGNPRKGTDRAEQLATPSGKVEFVAQTLLAHTPDDDERPPLPHYIPSWEGHTSELAAKYPLQLISPHPRFSFHTQHDTHVPWLSEIPGHRTFKDGYAYQVVRMHPDDAQGQGHQARRRREAVQRPRLRAPDRPGDRAREAGRGALLRGRLQVRSARARQGRQHRRGGCVNLLTPSRMMSKNVPGMAPNSCLVEMERWDR